MKTETLKKLICAFLAMALLCSLTTGVLAGGAVLDADSVNRFDVMLVMDGSGSLVAGKSATDKNGLRYDAINLFLALLTNSGNRVGAVVFDDQPANWLLSTDLMDISGKSDKVSLSESIRAAGTRGGTDIGSALLTAVETLTARASDQYQPVIILFSDGRTDLDTEEELETSLENKEKAIVGAQDAGIPIFSICLNASSVSDPQELSDISNRTSGGFVAVSRAEDMAEAFETFYQLIFNSPASEKSQLTFGADGIIEYAFEVPTVGAEEVNVILKRESIDSMQVNSPTSQLTQAQLEDSTMTGGSYQVIKLVRPEMGQWKLQMQGQPGSAVTVNVIYNLDSSAILSTADGRTDYDTGEQVTLQAQLRQEGNVVTNSAVTREYTATLHLTRMADGTTRDVEMTPGEGGKFVYTLPSDGSSSYSAYVTLSFASLVHNSNTVQVNFDNTPPQLTGEETITQKVVVTPVSGRSRSIDVSEYFTDTQQEPLRYEIASSQLVEGTAQLQDGLLTVNTAESRSGDVVITAADKQGAENQMTIHFQVTNLTLPIFITLAAAVLAGLVVLAVIVWGVTHPLWRGTVSVATLDRSRDMLPRSRGSFRGKVKLRYFMVGQCGLDPEKSFLVVKRGGKLAFRSDRTFYVNGMPMTETELYAGTNIINTEERGREGIRIEVRPRNYR